MKTNSNYRISKSLKRRLALAKYPSKVVRNAWKRAMISAEVHAGSVERVIAFGRD